MKAWFSAIEVPTIIKLIHLNGSSSKLSSYKDVHEIPFSPDDCIWGAASEHGKCDYDNSGVRAVIEFCKQYDTGLIMEINRGDERHTSAMQRILSNEL